MPQDTITLIVPASAEYARTVRMTAAAVVARMPFTYDEVEDVRMAAEEAFIYAVDTLAEDADVTFRFVLRGTELEIDVTLGGTPDVSDEEVERRATYATFILQVGLRRAAIWRAMRTAACSCACSSARRVQMPSSRRPEKQSRKLSWDKQYTRELFRRYRLNGDEDARDELITMYLNLVKYLASRFRNRGEPIDDLVQVGTIGLIKAIDRFDIDRQVEFTTYATPTIVGELKRYFRDKGWAIKVPRRLQELSFRVNQAVDALTQRLQRSPSIPEIAEYLEVTPEEVLEAMETSEAYNFVSLESDRGGDGSDTFSILEYIGKDDMLMAVVDDRTTLQAAFKQLTPQEQRVLYLRFFEGLTQTEIARQLNISQMQVSRLLRRTLRILRENIVRE